MYNRDNELEKFFEDIDFDDKSLEMTNIKKVVKRKAFIHKTVVATRNTTFAFVAIFAIMFVGAKSSPAVANAISNIPLLGDLFVSVESEGVQDAILHDYLTEVNQTDSTEYGDITLSYYMADEIRIVFMLKGEFDNEVTHASVSSVKLKNLNTGEIVEMSNDCPNYLDNESGFVTLEMEEWPEEWGYTKNLGIIVGNIVEKDGNYNSVEVSYELKLGDYLEAKELEVNDTFEVRGQKLHVNKIYLYPTCTKVMYEWDAENTMECIDFEMHVEDENGIEKGSNQRTIWHGENYVIMGSGYFTLGDKLSVGLDEISLLPKDMIDITYDMDKEELKDSTGVVKNIYVGDYEELKKKYGEETMVYFSKENIKEIEVDGEVKKAFINPPIIIDIEESNVSIPLRLGEEEIKEYIHLNSFIGMHKIECENGESLSYVYIPKKLRKDKDGIIHLKRCVAEFFEYPELVMPIY